MENHRKELEKACADWRLIVKDSKIITVMMHPTPFPLCKYREAKSKQKIVNKLFHNIMLDKRILQTTCANSMYCMLKNIALQRKVQKAIQFLFIRTDYLLDARDDTMKQVEINTISCSFLVYGPRINRIHSRYAKTIISDSDIKFVEMVVVLRALFEKMQRMDNTIALLLDERKDQSTPNYFEKIGVIHALREKGIDMEYVTMDDIVDNASFVSGNMLYRGRVVFFVYYRWFYNMSHYGNGHIDVREKIEHSSALSLPSAELQIAGLKMFQVSLKDKEFLRRYLSQDEIDAIYGHFGDFKQMHDYESGDEHVFLLKSLDEGGNNIVVADDFSQYIGKDSYFMMKKIASPSFTNRSIASKEDQQFICELGVFGYLISVDGKVILNKDAGYIVRSKAEDSLECGITCGHGTLDSLESDK